jgi:hypothetical protein
MVGSGGDWGYVLVLPALRISWLVGRPPKRWSR